MTRELLEQMRTEGRLVPASMYLRKSRAEEHMGLEETLSRHCSSSSRVMGDPLSFSGPTGQRVDQLA